MKNSQEIARIFEDEVAENYGVRVLGSGSATFKGDVRGEGLYEDYLFEAKYRSKSFSVNAKLFNKIKFEALHQGRKPIIILKMDGLKENWVMLPERLWKQFNESILS